MLLTALLPVLDLSVYSYVWIFDGDIYLQDFDMNTFSKTVRCSFPIPPLVSQPLVYENSQVNRYR